VCSEERRFRVVGDDPVPVPEAAAAAHPSGRTSRPFGRHNRNAITGGSIQAILAAGRVGDIDLPSFHPEVIWASELTGVNNQQCIVPVASRACRTARTFEGHTVDVSLWTTGRLCRAGRRHPPARSRFSSTISAGEAMARAAAPRQPRCRGLGSGRLRRTAAEVAVVEGEHAVAGASG